MQFDMSSGLEIASFLVMDLADLFATSFEITVHVS